MTNEILYIIIIIFAINLVLFVLFNPIVKARYKEKWFAWTVITSIINLIVIVVVIGFLHTG